MIGVGINEAAKIRKVTARTVIYVFLSVYALTSIFPFLWSILSSLKENEGVLLHTLSLPKAWKFQNYPHAWTSAHMGLYFTNTGLYAVTATAALLMIAPMASYVIARVRPNLALYTYYTLGIMIPVYATLLPSFILLRDMRLLDTRASIILLYIAFNISMSVFILTGFMRGMPKELEEAALIDGCSRTRSFFQIIMPLSTPGLATIGILAFLDNWNNFFVPLIILNNSNLKVLTLGVQELRGLYSQDYGLVTAGLVISFLPVVVIYILFQEKVIAGLTAGAVKG